MRPELKEFSDKISTLSDKNLSKLSSTDFDSIRLEIDNYIAKVVEVCANDEAEIKSIFSAEEFGNSRSNIIHVVAKFGDHLQMEELIKFMNDYGYVNARNAKSFTALHYAAIGGWIEMVRFLLKNGADANPRASIENRLWTPNHFAAKHGHLEIVQELLNAGVAREFKTSFGLTIFHIAAENGHTEIVKFLLQGGINKDDKTVIENYEMTPLHYAVIGGHQNTTLALLEAKVNREAATTNGETALIIAAKNGKLAIVSMLLKWGVGLWDEAYEIAKINKNDEVASEIKRYLEARKNIFKNPKDFSSNMIAKIKEFNADNLSEEKIALEANGGAVLLNAYGVLGLKHDSGMLFKTKKTLLELAAEKQLSDLCDALTKLERIIGAK